MSAPCVHTSEYRKAVDSFIRQALSTHQWLASLDTHELSTASVLDGWDVITLAAHLVMMQEGLTSRLTSTTKLKPLVVGDYVATYAGAAQEISNRTHDLRAGRSDAELLQALADSAEPGDPLVQVLPTEVLLIPGRGPIQVIDWLDTRIVELVVHADDLNRSLPDRTPIVLDREALGRVCRLLMRILASRAPGKAVEVRVPPFAAAQVVEGVGHTRGTPPNVVEMGPLAWVRLAAGRQTWDELVRAGAINASGSRADLAGLVPLFR